MPSVHIEIIGRVQGVGFRWFVRERARSLGVRGWVRNLANGAVEVAAQGESRDLDSFVQAIEQGPDGAQVERVERRTPPADGHFPDPFSILR